MKSYIAVLIVLLLAACSSNPPARYQKDNAGRDEFDEIAYRCKLKTIQTLSSEIRDQYGNVTPEKKAVDCDAFNTCMASKGFKKSVDGGFSVGQDEEIRCK